LLLTKPFENYRSELGKQISAGLGKRKYPNRASRAGQWRGLVTAVSPHGAHRYGSPEYEVATEFGPPTPTLSKQLGSPDGLDEELLPDH